MYGTPDTIYHSTNGTIWAHFVIYDEAGVAAFVVNNSETSILDTDPIALISLAFPYQGMTEEKIGIGSTLNFIKSEYGEPEDINAEYGIYDKSY